MTLTLPEIEEIVAEITTLNKEMALQLRTQAHVLFALLHVIDRSSLLKVKAILEAQAADPEFAVNAAAISDALRTVALIFDAADPRTAFRLIPGGKGDD